jgi:hypothetical protein
MMALLIALSLSREIQPASSVCVAVADKRLRELCTFYERDGSLCAYLLTDKEKKACIKIYLEGKT